MEENNMPKFYWAEAVWTIVYIHNQISAHGEKKSAHELYFERKLNVGHLRVFSSIAYMYMC